MATAMLQLPIMTPLDNCMGRIDHGLSFVLEVFWSETRYCRAISGRILLRHCCADPAVDYFTSSTTTQTTQIVMLNQKVGASFEFEGMFSTPSNRETRTALFPPGFEGFTQLEEGRQSVGVKLLPGLPMAAGMFGFGFPACLCSKDILAHGIWNSGCLGYGYALNGLAARPCWASGCQRRGHFF